MKKEIKPILATLLLCISNLCAEEILKEGPFSGIDVSTLPSKQAAIIRAANEDFVLVQRGKRPRNAVSANMAAPADGGTTYWKSDGYFLTIFKSLSDFGELGGYVYGPSIQFEAKFATGNMESVMSTRFYTYDQMDRFLETQLSTNQAPQAIGASAPQPGR